MWFKSQINIFLFLVLLFSSRLSNVHGQEVSNLKFLANLTDSLLEEVSKKILDDTTRPVKIRSLESNKDVTWFFVNQLIEVLKKNDHAVIYLNQGVNYQDLIQKDGSSFTVFEFKVLSIGVEYVDHRGGGLFGSGEIKRKGNVALSLRIFNQPSGEILWSGDIEGTRFDWIPANEIDVVENPNIPFTQANYPSSLSTKKIIEPILITGVTGIIIFLFYSLRSR